MRPLCLLLMWMLAYAGGHAQTVEEILMPRHMQGNQPSNTNRLPFACRLVLKGLEPSKKYRYLTRAVIPTNGSTNDGAGTSIFPEGTGTFRRSGGDLATNGSYGEFTTNATGEYTGWFIMEPTGNSRFAQGGTVRIRLLLNNGNDGTTVATRLTAPSEITIVEFGDNPNGGTGIRSTPAAGGFPRNFVMLYDNANGTGRPVAGTFIEADGTVGSSLAAWYGNETTPGEVNDRDGAWGTIIPNFLTTGIRRIAQFDRASGSQVGANTSADGTWPTTGGGTISTVNPSGGLSVLVIDGAQVSLPVGLLSFSAFLNQQRVAELQWQVTEEQDLSHYQVEYSSEGTKFKPVGRVLASQQSRYSFLVNNLAAQNFFRLAMVDKDGSVAWSKVVSHPADQPPGLSAWPNPAVDRITVQHEAMNNGVLRIVSSTGTLVKHIRLPDGTIQSSISLSGLPAGMYYLQTMDQEKKSSYRIIKQ